MVMPATAEPMNAGSLTSASHASRAPARMYFGAMRSAIFMRVLAVMRRSPWAVTSVVWPSPAKSSRGDVSGARERPRSERLGGRDCDERAAGFEVLGELLRARDVVGVLDGEAVVARDHEDRAAVWDIDLLARRRRGEPVQPLCAEIGHPADVGFASWTLVVIRTCI